MHNNRAIVRGRLSVAGIPQCDELDVRRGELTSDHAPIPVTTSGRGCFEAEPTSTPIGRHPHTCKKVAVLHGLGRNGRRLVRRAPRGILHLAMTPKQIVHSDPEILGGTPVFVGTRVPVDALIDFLEGGETVEDFLENYPGVSREQVFAFLEEASRALLAEIA